MTLQRIRRPQLRPRIGGQKFGLTLFAKLGAMTIRKALPRSLELSFGVALFLFSPLPLPQIFHIFRAEKISTPCHQDRGHTSHLAFLKALKGDYGLVIEKLC